MSQSRNDPCSCGSGRKYKQCCENKPSRTQWYRYAAGGTLALVIAVGFVGGIMDWASREPIERGPAPPGKVWSEEHGHYHDIAQKPGGTAPAGQIWSEEHGHFHDAPADTAPPDGTPPPGKVWDAEHGHYHDLPGGGTAGGDTVDVDALPPLEGTGTSPAPVSPAPTTDANG